MVVALTVPFGCLGGLLATATHEVVGHGLVSLAVGGRFLGFQIDFDGMGYAFVPVPQDASVWRHVAVQMGGIIATTVCGAVLLLLGVIARRRPWVSVPLFLVAFNLLMDGPPYAFWNAIHPVYPGDVAWVVAVLGAPARVVCIVAGGAIMLISIWVLTAMLLWTIESWVMAGRRLTGMSRSVVLLLLGAGPGMWSLFDWDQLAPGVGGLPNVVSLILHLLTVLSLYWIGFRPTPIHPGGHMMAVSISVGWVALLAAVAATAIWLRPGVFWAV